VPKEQAVMQPRTDAASALLKRDMVFLSAASRRSTPSVTDGKADDVKKMMAEFTAGVLQFESARERPQSARSSATCHRHHDGCVEGTYAGKSLS